MYLRTSLDKLFHHLINFRIFKRFSDGCCSHPLVHNSILQVCIFRSTRPCIHVKHNSDRTPCPTCYSWKLLSPFIPPHHFSQVFTDLLFMSCSLFSKLYWLYFDSSFSISGSTIFCTPLRVHIRNKQTLFWTACYPFH